MTAQTPQLAFDIETISPDVPPGRRPDFGDSSQFELLAGTVAYQARPSGDIETVVQFRDGRGPAAELTLIEQLLDLLTDSETARVLTYNGDAFDFPHLLGRAQLAAADLGTRETVPARVDTVLETIESDDLIHDAWDAFGEYTALEDACRHAEVEIPNTNWTDYDHGLDPADWRPPADQGTPHVVSADVPQLGERYLDRIDAGLTGTQQFHQLEAILTEYAVTDFEPLFSPPLRRPFPQTHTS
jgi:hypothetical protein